MDLKNMLVICGIPGMHNNAGGFLTHIFIYSRVFTGIGYFNMLIIKYVPHMIKDHNLVPNE